MEIEEYEYKIINSILRKKVKEQAEYIASLETKLGIPNLQEQELNLKIKDLAKKAKTNKKRK